MLATTYFLAKYILHIQFTIFHTYFSTKLSFTNKRYNAVWMGTIYLEDHKNEMRRQKEIIESSQNFTFFTKFHKNSCFPLGMN